MPLAPLPSDLVNMQPPMFRHPKGIDAYARISARPSEVQKLHTHKSLCSKDIPSDVSIPALPSDLLELPTDKCLRPMDIRSHVRISARPSDLL